MKTKADALIDIMAPIRKAIDRMHAAERAWAAQEPQPESGPAIRADVVRAIRASALCERSIDDYLMAFGIGGPNPCRSQPVELARWGEGRPIYGMSPERAALFGLIDAEQYLSRYGITGR